MKREHGMKMYTKWCYNLKRGHRFDLYLQTKVVWSFPLVHFYVPSFTSKYHSRVAYWSVLCHKESWYVKCHYLFCSSSWQTLQQFHFTSVNFYCLMFKYEVLSNLNTKDFSISHSNKVLKGNMQEFNCSEILLGNIYRPFPLSPHWLSLC